MESLYKEQNFVLNLELTKCRKPIDRKFEICSSACLVSVLSSDTIKVLLSPFSLLTLSADRKFLISPFPLHSPKYVNNAFRNVVYYNVLSLPAERRRREC